ncbi:MAG: nonstructural protein [Microviridae sp.]|nr:MAG: nonstructural protein [Microviridae sp.]
MTQTLYSIYDSVSQLHTAPAPFVNEATAIRSFANLINNDDSPYAINYRDYSLFRIGEWKDSAGTVTPFPAPEFVVSGRDVLQRGDEEDVRNSI